MQVTKATEELLISPYGERLVNLLIDDQERIELVERASHLPAVQLSLRSLCDLELMATGAFSPLDRFMAREDYHRVLEEMRLANGVLFPISITLPVSPGPHLGLDQEIALRSPKNELIALMTVEEIYRWDPLQEAEWILGTTDLRHPLVAEMAFWGANYISGSLRVIDLPKYYDFRDLRLTPRNLRNRLGRMGLARVVAFQTRNPIHRGHEWMMKKAADEIDGALLVHPAVGLTKPGDVEHFARIRSYKSLVEQYFDRRRTLLGLIPLAMRLAGPREAVWHAIVRRNYGASHFIVGRDHASPGVDSKGQAFYEPSAAQEMMASLESEVGVSMIPFDEVIYLPDGDRYTERRAAPEGARVWSISGTRVRDEFLAKGEPLPAWFTRPEVAAILQRTYLPRHEQGFCVWFTGLPCAGKSTIAEILTVELLERGRRVTFLDGDVVRTHLSKGLGFSREDRDTNILRIAFVASEIVRHHGAAIAAAVSPYRATRNQARALVGSDRFVLVYVDTPLEICVARDSKGLYDQARRGQIQGVTGIDDPYEEPQAPDLVLHAGTDSPEECARQVLELVSREGFVEP